MSALDELRNKDTSRITHLDFVILAYPEKEQIHIGDADISIAAAAELAALREENEKLRSGAELGPIVGMEVIAKQEAELAALRRVVDMAELALVVMRRDHPNCFEENREWCEYVQLKQALDELPE